MSRRVALVSGSSRGLGRTIAQRLAAEDGLWVAVNGLHDDEHAREVAAAIRRAVGRPRSLPGDVTDEREVVQLVTAIAGSLGSIDVLVVDATGPRPEASLDEVGWPSCTAQLDFFLRSPFVLGAPLPAGDARGAAGGRIVQIDSEVVDTPPPGAACPMRRREEPPSSGSCEGLGARVRARGHHRQRGGAPGFMPVERHDGCLRTRMNGGHLSHRSRPGGWAPGRRRGRGEASSRVRGAGFITGQRVLVDGGRSLALA